MLTNEEKRVPTYQMDSTPTRPDRVEPSTPIETFNLNWRESDLPERERTRHVHRLHPYLGKFIPQLVEVFLRKYFTPGQTVLDPFCGSGTTLVQANELGIASIGCDISAFNALLCRAKTQHYDKERVQKEVLDVLERTHNSTQPEDTKQLTMLLDKAVPLDDHAEPDAEYLQRWYAPQALRELLAYRHFVQQSDYLYKDLLYVILSRSARSARLTTHFDLDFPKQPQREPYWCYKHGRICEPTTDAFKFLRRYSVDTIRRVKQFALVRTDAPVTIYHADSRTISLPAIDGIITSPPYVGLIDYHEQHAYAYHLLNLDDRRGQEIGAAANGASERAKALYVQSITEVFQNALGSMRSGGHLIVIANDKYDLYEGIARNLKVEVEGVVHRHVNRRTGRRSGEFYESIFIWRKLGEYPLDVEKRSKPGCSFTCWCCSMCVRIFSISGLSGSIGSAPSRVRRSVPGLPGTANNNRPCLTAFDAVSMLPPCSFAWTMMMA